MLIRSQNKVQLIPVGEFAFSVMLNGSISANKNIFATVHKATQSIVGRYSTREKAIKVLDMICDAYEGNKYEETYHEGAYDYVPVFQMPEDDEVTI